MTVETTNRFGAFVAERAAAGALVVQPRMGVDDPRRMRTGLAAVRDCAATTVGTITLDSFTRVGDHDAARDALANGFPLNGYPIVAHGAAITGTVLSGVQSERFPIQVRHGSALPTGIFKELVDAGVDATEGGPVSYCLPYSRVPLAEATRAWQECAQLAAPTPSNPRGLHLESFGGCMLGQLCPPSLLLAISVLEAMFFAQHGVQSISLSYAQQTHREQDIAALQVLGRLGRTYVPVSDQHVVFYTFMGVYPASELGSYHLLAASAEIARAGGAQRLIVKTPAEAHRIPTFHDNVSSLEFAHAWRSADASLLDSEEGARIEREARTLIEATLQLDGDVGAAMVKAFDLGLLDVPYCLHPNNKNQARAHIDDSGRLAWSQTGGLPISQPAVTGTVTAQRLLSMLEHNRQRYDRRALQGWASKKELIA